MSSHQASPDSGGRRVVVDQLGAPVSAKQASMMATSEADRREDERAGAADLDARVEATAGMTRQAKDAARSRPRDLSTPPPDPRMRRKLPAPDQVRTPLSARQKNARSKLKREIQGQLTNTEYTATAELMNETRWTQVNDALARSVGDVQQLPDDQIRQIQRVDRFIQKHQRANDRADVVYVNLRPPRGVNRSNVEGFVRKRLPPGSALSFDRFTAGALNLHEIEAGARADTDPVIELQTPRAAYLGRSARVDDSAVLLQRGLTGVTVVGHHWATYQRPDGTTGRRLAIQAVDTQSTGN